MQQASEPTETARRDSGVTLLEMIVVVGILGLVIALAFGMLITITKQIGVNAVRIDQSAQSKVAMDSMTKSLRTAVLPKQLLASCTNCDSSAFITGEVRKVKFYANLNNDYTVTASPSAMTTNGPSQVTYAVDSAGNLVETIRRPDPHLSSATTYTFTCVQGVGGCVVTTRTIATKVSTTQTLFTYYDRTGATLTPPLTTDGLSSVDSVDITLQVQISPNTAPLQTVTRVFLPNAGVVPESSASASP